MIESSWSAGLVDIERLVPLEGLNQLRGPIGGGDNFFRGSRHGATGPYTSAPKNVNEGANVVPPHPRLSRHFVILRTYGNAQSRQRQHQPESLHRGGRAGVRICSPQIGLSSRSNLGGAVYDYEVLKELAALGVELEIPHLKTLDTEVLPGWHIHPIALNRQFKLGGLLSNAAFGWKLRSVTKARRPDLLRVAYPWYSGPASVHIGGRFGIPTAVAFHHLEADESRLESRVHRWVARHSTGIHTGSRFGARQLAERYGVAEETIAVIPYGVDARYRPNEAERRRVRDEHRLGERIVVLHVGSLIARKNLLFLVEVFESIEAKPPPLLLLCGEGYPKDDYAERLAARIDRSNARDRIRLLGRVSEDDKLGLYRACDIVVHPAHVEGFGFAVAEGMACGRAVLAARAGSLPEVVDEDETGLLASPNNPEEFRNKLSILVTDSSSRQRLGARAAKVVAERFTWERTAQMTLDYYERIVRAS